MDDEESLRPNYDGRGRREALRRDRAQWNHREGERVSQWEERSIRIDFDGGSAEENEWNFIRLQAALYNIPGIYDGERAVRAEITRVLQENPGKEADVYDYENRCWKTGPGPKYPDEAFGSLGVPYRFDPARAAPYAAFLRIAAKEMGTVRVMYAAYKTALHPLREAMSRAGATVQSYTDVRDSYAIKDYYGDVVPFFSLTIIEASTQFPARMKTFFERELDNLMPPSISEEDVERDARAREDSLVSCFSKMRWPLEKWLLLAHRQLEEFEKAMTVQLAEMGTREHNQDVVGMTMCGSLIEIVRRCYMEDTEASIVILDRALQSLGHHYVPGSEVNKVFDFALGPTEEHIASDIARSHAARMISRLRDESPSGWMDPTYPIVTPMAWRDKRIFDEICQDTSDMPQFQEGILIAEDTTSDAIIIELSARRRRVMEKDKRRYEHTVHLAINARIIRDIEDHRIRDRLSGSNGEITPLWQGRSQRMRREELATYHHLIDDDLTPESMLSRPYVNQVQWDEWERRRPRLDGWIENAMLCTRAISHDEATRLTSPIRSRGDGRAQPDRRVRGRVRDRDEYEGDNE